MNRKRLLITVLLLMVGGGFGVYCLQKNRKPDVDPVSSSKQNEVIIAPAIIDAPNDITRIPSLQSGMMKQIDVQVGDQVKKGQPLFSLESGLVENALHINQLSVLQAKHALRIQKKQLKHLENQLARLNRLDKRAISMAELQEKQHEVNIAKAQLAQGVVNEALAQSQLKNTELTLEQYSVVAPKEGVVLQINAHPHEFVSGGQPLTLWIRGLNCPAGVPSAAGRGWNRYWSARCAYPGPKPRGSRT